MPSKSYKYNWQLKLKQRTTTGRHKKRWQDIFCVVPVCKSNTRKVLGNMKVLSFHSHLVSHTKKRKLPII